MQKSLIAIAGLAVSGVWVVACTMKAPQDVSQAATKVAAIAPSVNLAASVPASKPAVAEQTTPPAVVSTARVEAAPKPAIKPEVTAPSRQSDVVVANGREDRAEKKPSRFAILTSAAGSLPLPPLLSLMRGEDGRISPVNLIMKVRSMMPMCAGGNCVTTSSGFQRVNGKEPVKPLTVATAG